MEEPRTIHDFGGFPQALYVIQYPARGDPALAARVRELLAPTEVVEDTSDWGLDHGTWSVLRHIYPKADVPVVQLSLDATQPLAYHYELATRLAPLRNAGVLIIGSGNVVHNLRTALHVDGATAFDWAARFNAQVRRRVLSHDHAGLADMDSLGPDAPLCIPTPEHYLPFLYAIALQRSDDRIAFPTDGIELGSISMMSVIIGSNLSP
jgi:4,5-DOPA dioxygenase extradiol